MSENLTATQPGGAEGAVLMAEILSPAGRPNPYPLYAELRDRRLIRDADGTYVVSAYEDVSALIRDPRLSADPARSPRGGQGMSFLAMDPPDHTRLRRIALRHFGPSSGAGRIAGMAPTLEAMVKALIDPLASRREIDIVADVAYPFPVTVIADLLGVPREDEPRFHAWAESIVQATDRDPDEPGRRTHAAQAGFQQLAAYMSGLISARRASPTGDMLSRMANEDGPDEAVSPEELVGIAVLLLLAGHETTVNLITNGMMTLLRFPEWPGGRLPRRTTDPLRRWWRRFCATIRRIPLYLSSPSTLSDIDRLGRRPAHSRGAPAVQADACRGQSRPRPVATEPDTFNPDRASPQHLGFGNGAHACFGAPLARLEGQIALRELARRLMAPRLLQDPPDYRFNPTLRGPRALKVAIDGVVD